MNVLEENYDNEGLKNIENDVQNILDVFIKHDPMEQCLVESKKSEVTYKPGAYEDDIKIEEKRTCENTSCEVVKIGEQQHEIKNEPGGYDNEDNTSTNNGVLVQNEIGEVEKSNGCDMIKDEQTVKPEINNTQSKIKEAKETKEIQKGENNNSSSISGEENYNYIKSFTITGVSGEILAAKLKKRTCSLCNYTTSNTNLLRDHRNLHNSLKTTYTCFHCHWIGKTVGQLRRHINTKHTFAKPYVCDICGFRTNYAMSLRTHLLVHTGEKPFKCGMCDYETRHNGDLKKHEMSHTGEWRYACQICGYRTNYSNSLKIHMLVHSGEKPFKCNLCDYSARRAYLLRVHQMTHTGEMRYICEVCNYGTNRSSSLKRHMAVHVEGTPFKCDICNYGSRNSRALKEHYMKHSGELRYSCDQCEYKTNYSSNLKAHIFIHTGEKPYKCDICNFGTRSGSSLRKHKVSHCKEKKTTTTKSKKQLEIVNDLEHNRAETNLERFIDIVSESTKLSGKNEERYTLESNEIKFASEINTDRYIGHVMQN